MCEADSSVISKLQNGFWNPQYSPQPESLAESRQRSSSISTPFSMKGMNPLPKPRRTMSVSCKDKKPVPRPRLLSRNSSLHLINESVDNSKGRHHEDGIIENPVTRPRSLSLCVPLGKNRKKDIFVDTTYSAPRDFTIEQQRSSSSTSVSLSQRSRSSSTSSSSPGPNSPSPMISTASSEQFWKQYKRTSNSVKSLSLLASLSLNDSGVESDLSEACGVESDHIDAELGDSFEPLYSEIYVPRLTLNPPLPEKASVRLPPARPPYPASSLLLKQKKSRRNKK